MINILTQRENEIINKKIAGHKLTQNESNILSKTIRPKLTEISKIDAMDKLQKLEYNQKARAIEQKIKKIIKESIPETEVIILCGSAIQTNYREYNDIDTIILTKEKLWASIGKKYGLIINLEKLAKKKDLNLDVQLIDKNSFYQQYPYNPSLIYQLKDSKIIYGKIKTLTKPQLSKLDLRMKLDWSDMEDIKSDGKEMYKALRNIMLVRLLMRKIVDNKLLNKEVSNEIGEEVVKRLKNNFVSKIEKRAMLERITKLSEQTDKEILGAKWEKIRL